MVAGFIISLFLSISLIFQSCQQAEKNPSVQLTVQEEAWLPEFLQDVFLEKGAIYTLWGTKPLTAFDICYYTEEELTRLKCQYGTCEEEDSRNIPVTRYTVAENWKRWEQMSSRFPMQNFLFFKRQDTLFPKIYRLYFFNKKLTEEKLANHYELFEKRTGFKFNIRQVMSEIEDQNSSFWDKVFNDSVLVGILYGYGKTNAESFMHIENSNKSFRFSDQLEVIGETDLSNFKLPIFASFSEEDEAIEKYSAERKKIKNFYKGKNFVYTTIEKMIAK